MSTNEKIKTNKQINSYPWSFSLGKIESASAIKYKFMFVFLFNLDPIFPSYKLFVFLFFLMELHKRPWYACVGIELLLSLTFTIDSEFCMIFIRFAFSKSDLTNLDPPLPP